MKLLSRLYLVEDLKVSLDCIDYCFQMKLKEIKFILGSLRLFWGEGGQVANKISKGR